MISRRSFRARFVFILLGLILGQGCTLERAPATADLRTSPQPPVIPTATAVSDPETPTPLPVTLTIPFPAVPTPTIPADLIAAVRIVVNAIETNQPGMLRELIGDEGVAAGGFAQGAKFKGYNNADEIVAAFDEALDRSTPVCEGFAPFVGALPDKVILVYRGLDLEWTQFGLSGKNSESITIQLFKLPEGWRFVGITPFDFEVHLPILGPLQDCPA